MRGVGLPKRLSAVVPLKDRLPKMLMSYYGVNSCPKPYVPLAGMTGLSSVTPDRETRKSLLLTR